jgi:type II secretory pathway component PulF
MDSWFPTFEQLFYQRGFPWLRPGYTSHAQQRNLLRLIANGLELNLPLPSLLEQWAADERGPQVARIQRLAQLLERGQSLPDAVEAVPGVLSDEQVLALRFDSQTGTRTAAIRATLLKLDSVGHQRRNNFRNTLVYLVSALLLAAVVIAYTSLLVVPKLQHVFQHFGLVGGQWLAWSQFLLIDSAPYTGLGLLVLLIMGTWLLGTISGRRFRRALAGRCLKSVHELRGAEVLQQMSVAASAGRPLPSALSTLARYHFDPTIRHELLVARNEMEHGVAVWDGLAQVGLISPPEARLLQITTDQGSPAWALQQLAQVRRQRVYRQFDRWSELLMPATVALLGLLVILQASLIFIPLITLMNETLP